MLKTEHNRIAIDPKVMLGKPVIKGTRITIELILRQLAQGVTSDEILENYPHLIQDDILAALGKLKQNKEVQKEAQDAWADLMTVSKKNSKSLSRKLIWSQSFHHQLRHSDINHIF